MKQRRRIYYSAAQRAEIWDRWKAGESMSSIHQKPKAVGQAGDCRPDRQAMRAQNCAPIPPPRFL